MKTLAPLEFSGDRGARRRWPGVVATLSRACVVGVLALAPAVGRADTPTQYQASYDAEAKGKYSDALEALELVAAGDRDGYVWHLRRGWLQYLAGQFGPSIDSYRMALEKAPRALEPQLGMLLPMLAARRFAEAEKVSVAILALDPHNSTALSKLAWARYSLGRYSDAAESYRKVLADYPSDVDMRAGLGWSLLKLGKSADAAAEFRAVLNVAPKHTSSKTGLDTLGMTP